jgi:hypothetical protein
VNVLDNPMPLKDNRNQRKWMLWNRKISTNLSFEFFQQFYPIIQFKQFLNLLIIKLIFSNFTSILIMKYIKHVQYF